MTLTPTVASQGAAGVTPRARAAEEDAYGHGELKFYTCVHPEETSPGLSLARQNEIVASIGQLSTTRSSARCSRIEKYGGEVHISRVLV